MKNRIYMVSLIMMTFIMIGCGTTESGLQSLSIKTSDTLQVGDVLYHLPESVSIEQKGDDIALLSSGNKQELGGLVYNTSTYSTSRSRSLSTLKTKYQSTIDRLKNASFMDMTYITQQEGSAGKVFVRGDYDVHTYEMIKPVDLVGKIIKVIAGDESLSLPVASSSSIAATDFSLTIQANEYTDIVTGKISTVFVATVVSKVEVSRYIERIKNITNYANITRTNVNIKTATETFLQTQGNSQADFLFVVDDSPSMSDNQDAISRAGDDFESVMLSTGLDVNFAIITTDAYHYDRIFNTVGIIQNDYNLFKQSIIVGDNGSATETGIYNAEYFLNTQQIFPRATTSTLSVVIISDEESQYDSISNQSFNPYDNIFTNRNIRVYSIIETAQNNDSQYDDLSIQTGGIIADINHQDSAGNLDFSSFMRKVATDAVGRTSQFVLKHNLIINRSTTIMINKKIIQQKILQASSGWVYEQASNSIVFYGDSVPKAGDSVTIEYVYDDTGAQQSINVQEENNKYIPTTQIQPTVADNAIQEGTTDLISTYARQGWLKLTNGELDRYSLMQVKEETIRDSGINSIVPLDGGKVLVLTTSGNLEVVDYIHDPFNTVYSISTTLRSIDGGYYSDGVVYIGNQSLDVSSVL